MKSIEPYSNENKKHVDTALCDIENVSNDQSTYIDSHTKTFMFYSFVRMGRIER